MPRLQKSDTKMRVENDLDSNFIQSLYRGLQIIVAFNKRLERQTLSDIARATDLPRATVRRTLMTLGHLGYVETDGRLFWLTPKIMELSSAYLTSNPVTAIYQPACDRIAKQMGHTVSAAVLNGDEAVVVAYAHGSPMTMNETWIGLRLPSYCTALGRVLLSGFSKSELDLYFERQALEPRTSFTNTNPRSIRKAIEEVQRKGYALVDQEASVGTRMVAIPIRRFDGRIVASLGFGARLEMASIKQLRDESLPLLLEATAGLNMLP